jgi:hypothetical protein
MTKSENVIEMACLEAGCWPRDVRTQIVERSGLSVEKLAQDPAVLKTTIEQHRSEKPNDFLPARMAREAERVPAGQRTMHMVKACYKTRDKAKGLQFATSRALSRVRGAEKGAAQ